MTSSKKAGELQSRVITGVIGASVLLLMIIFLGRTGVALIGAILSLGMIYEFIEICFTLEDKAEKRMVLLGTTWLIAFANFWIPRVEYELLILTFIGLFAYFLFSVGRHRDQAAFALHFRELVFSIFGIFYLTFIPLYLPLIRDGAHGLHWTLLFLLIVWSGDTGAYFAGKKYGKRKLYPVISPKKTVEGSIGGLAAGVVVSLIYKFALFAALSVSDAILTALVVGAVAAVGDLCESFLKRAFDKKDSGSILPGHGGFLDRFDGVVFSLPVMYACMRVFG